MNLSFFLFISDRPIYLYRHTRQYFIRFDACVVDYHWFGGSIVIVWDAILFVLHYNLIFQHDNAFLCFYGLHSAPLSPIKHFWNELDRRNRGRNQTPIEQLQALHGEWDTISIVTMNKLIGIDALGGQYSLLKPVLRFSKLGYLCLKKGYISWVT